LTDVNFYNVALVGVTESNDFAAGHVIGVILVKFDY